MIRSTQSGKEILNSWAKAIRMLIVAIIFLISCMVPARAGQDAKHTGHEHHDHASMDKSEKRTARAGSMVIPDIEVINQDGEKLNFYSDLVRGRVVVINFIFTTCTTICPPLTATFSQVQKLGGDRAGKDFYLISISVDPVTDTPQRLKAWGAKFKAKPGWTFVTGEKHNIDELLKSLGGFTAQIEDHSPLVLIGNDSKGVWTRTYGLAPPAKLLEIVEGAIKGTVKDKEAK
ncbi:MAG: SCO family protein [Blastocatellia bacterium]|nr:SCO family protein [Blastocatellia bacterium]